MGSPTPASPPSTMRPREWLLSAFFVLFLALKLAEAGLALESWPLTHVPMFAERKPPGLRPYAVTVHALRHGKWVELRPWMLRLNADEIARRLRGAPDLAAACGDLVRAFNARRRPHLRFEAAYAISRVHALPGDREPAEETRIDCRIDAAVSR